MTLVYPDSKNCIPNVSKLVRYLPVVLLVVALSVFTLHAETHKQKVASFNPGQVMLDTSGKPINAHGAGMLYYGGKYYWFGEIMEGKTVDQHVKMTGISCYSSRDLVHWKNEGMVYRALKADPSNGMAPIRFVERPKVIYNEKTKKFIMWFHIDDPTYQYARAAVAISDRPTGPYRFLRSYRPNGADSRDMTLFKDTDGKAYLVFASEKNETTHVAQLTDDYLNFDGKQTRVFINQFREGAAVFTYKGKYYLITSKCAGWNFSAALYAVAPSMLGPWKEMPNPAVGPGADKTFDSQSTYVLPVEGMPGAFIFMADRWDPANLPDSRYVWLPISVAGDKMEIRWHDHWDLNWFKQAQPN